MATFLYGSFDIQIILFIIQLLFRSFFILSDQFYRLLLSMYKKKNLHTQINLFMNLTIYIRPNFHSFYTFPIEVVSNGIPFGDL